MLTPISYVAVFMIVLVLGSVYIVTPIPPQHMQWFLRFASRIILLCCGQWLRVVGKPPDPRKGTYMILPNHQSAFDMFMLAIVMPEYFGIVAADYHFRIWFWRWIAIRFGAIPIEREKRDKAIEGMNQAEIILTGPDTEQRRWLVVFAEGERCKKNGLLQRFKLGASHIAKATGVLVVPCGIIGACESYGKYSWLIRPGILTWVWGEPQEELATNYSHYTFRELTAVFQHMVATLIGQSDPQ